MNERGKTSASEASRRKTKMISLEPTLAALSTCTRSGTCSIALCAVIPQTIRHTGAYSA